MPFFFFFNYTATTEIYTLSLHDALPISRRHRAATGPSRCSGRRTCLRHCRRSEEHTSELQSPCNLVCRLLLEKKKRRAPQHQRDPQARARFEAPPRQTLAADREARELPS